MKVIHIAIVLFVICLIGLISAFLKRANLTAKESGQRALMAESQMLLEVYRSDIGHYPDQLTSLQFTYPDGSTEEFLKDIFYTPTGDYYTLKTVGYSSGEFIILEPPKAEPDHDGRSEKNKKK